MIERLKDTYVGSLLSGAISALLLTLSFPYFGLSYLAMIALVPLFYYIVKSKEASKAAWAGFSFGAFLYLFTMYFIGSLEPLALPVLCIAKGLAPALIAYLIYLLKDEAGIVWGVGTAAAWVLGEYLHSIGTLGVTWAFLPLAFVNENVFMQCNSLTGMWGLTFAIALINALICSFCTNKKDFRLALVVLCTWIGVLLWGYYSLNSVENTDKVQMWGVVQPGLSQMDRFDPAKEDDNLHHNLNLSAKCLEETEPAEVVAWPETSIPYRGFLLRKSKIRKFQTCVQDHQAWYILGSIEYSADNMPRNTISVWNEEGDCVDRYDKYKLVPFGEYLPGRDYWPKWIPGIDKVMNYSSGEAIKPVEVDGTKVGVLICFESLSTFMARQQVLNGAEVLFVPTNDAWFGESVELPYHFAMARFRAAELQRPVVQVGNTGVSGFIDKFGRVKRELPINIDGYLVESVEPCQKLTLYALWGDYFVIISFLLWGTCFILSKLRGRFFIM